MSCLVLTLRAGESLTLDTSDGPIVVKVGRRVSVAVDAPKAVLVGRIPTELAERITMLEKRADDALRVLELARGAVGEGKP